VTITDADMIVYEYGARKVWPKPELNTPYQVLDHYNSLMGRLNALSQLVHISSGRPDHLVKSLDTLAFSLREAMFQVMVLRESIAGFQTKELAETADSEVMHDR
jgi:hypothetical protein